MNEFSSVLSAMNRLIAVLGGDCEQGMPQPQSLMHGAGSRNFIVGTQFQGTLVAPAVGATTGEIAVPAFALQLAESYTAGGAVQANARIRVYFTQPDPTKGGDAGDYIVLEKAAGHPTPWIHRRRGWESIWITIDNVVDVHPVIKLCKDPSFFTGV